MGGPRGYLLSMRYWGRVTVVAFYADCWPHKIWFLLNNIGVGIARRYSRENIPKSN